MVSTAPILLTFTHLSCPCTKPRSYFSIATKLQPRTRYLGNRRRRAWNVRCVFKRGENQESVYEQVIAALPLSTIFADYLGKSALHSATDQGDYKVVCPFHDDKNPSLHLSDSKKVWHCFGCQASGNLFSLEKRINSLKSVPDALCSLAERYSVVAKIVGESIPQTDFSQQHRDASYPPPPGKRQLVELPKPRQWGRQLRDKRKVASILETAQEYFRRNYAESRAAQDYVAARGLSSETAELFGLGFAPGNDAMNACINALTGEGYDVKSCVLAGVAKSGKGERVYDVFRDRLMIPIRSKSGELLSFAGRLFVESETSPKYVNGASSPVFQKKDILFGLHVAREAESASREYGIVVMVEGYIDVLSLHEKSKGTIACVASMGTAVSEEQIEAACSILMDRADGKVIINFDGDDAGHAAAERLCESVLPGMTEVSCVHIAHPPPYFKDVGEYLEAPNASYENYVKHLEETALHWIEWRVRKIMQVELDARAAAMTDVEVAQAAELGALGEADASFDMTNDFDEDGEPGSAKLFDMVQRGSEALLQDWSGANATLDDGHLALRARINRSAADPSTVSKTSSISRLTPGARRSDELSYKHQKNLDKGDGKIAGCPIELLDELAKFMGKALRNSPGVNVEWLVHCWACSLSDGITKRVPVLFEAMMERIDACCESWEKDSPARLVDMMRLGPWDYERQRWPQRKRIALALDDTDDKDAAVLFKDKKNLRRSMECIEFENRVILPSLERTRSPATRHMKFRPRATSEEIILRSLLQAKEKDRLEALDKLLTIMIRMEETDLFPFWTSQSRESLFHYLVDLTRELTVEEMAAECEEKEWWNPEIELVFFKAEDFGDKELESLREIEVLEPVLSVCMAASAIEEMARKVASGRAIDKLSAYIGNKLRTASLADDESLVHRDDEERQQLLAEVSGMRYLMPEELEEYKEKMKKVRDNAARQRQLRELESKLRRGEFTERDPSPEEENAEDENNVEDPKK